MFVSEYGADGGSVEPLALAMTLARLPVVPV